MVAKPRSLTYGQRLRQVMVERGYNMTSLASAIGVTPTAVSRLINGRTQPRTATAARLADLLIAPELASKRIGKCEVCGATTYSAGTKPRKYCGNRCQSVASGRRRNGHRATLSQLRSSRFALYQETVERYCNWCEPDGICKTAACILREVSPLPLRAA